MTATTMRRVALVFPGQGSQRAGMCADLLVRWPQVVRPVLDEASDAIQLDLARLMLHGPQEQLTRTAVAQPALLAHSTAVLRVLRHEGALPVVPAAVHCVLGHSLGEYSALVAAGALAFADAVRLVHARGKAMQRAVAPGAGAMAALMPVSAQDAEEVCRLAVEQSGQVCQVANYNSSKQAVVSGARDAVEQAVALAKSLKKVRRAVLLDVSAPFHCSLMAPAADELRVELDSLLSIGAIQEPTVPVVWNTEAKTTRKTPAEIADALARQVTHPVLWSQSVDHCLADGVDAFVELGAGSVLAGLIRQHAPKSGAVVRSCGTADEVDAALVEWAEEA